MRLSAHVNPSDLWRADPPELRAPARRIAAVLCVLSLACASPPAEVPEAGPSTSAASGPAAAPGLPQEAAEPPADAADPGAAGSGEPSEPNAAVEPLQPLSPEEAELGARFQPLADAFGFTEYVRSARTRGGVLFEYLPEGDVLERWTYLGTLLLVPVGESWEEGDAMLPRYVEAFTSGTRVLNERGVFTAPEGDVWIFDYELGTGALHEHNLAAVWQVLPGTLAVFQVQHRPEPFSQFQIDHFKSIAGQLRPAVER
jgi:hypothetical protein